MKRFIVFVSVAICFVEIAYGQSANWKVFYTSTSPLPNDTISGLSVDKTGGVWISTWNGLTCYKNGSWTVYRTDNSGIPANKCSIARMDDSLHLWIGSTAGLTRYDGLSWSTFNGVNWNEVNNLVNDIRFDRDGAVWFGTNYGSLVKYNHYNFINVPKWQGNRVYSIHINKEDVKYIGTTTGLWDYDGVKFTQISQKICNAVIIDDSSYVWYAEENCLAKAKIGEQTIKYDMSNTRLPSNFVNALTASKYNDLWVGTANGICHYDGQSWEPYTTGNSPIPHGWVMSLARDSSGNIWIGTLRGLAVFNPTGLVLSTEAGVGEVSVRNFDMKVAPNPARSNTNILINNPTRISGLLVVRDLLGRTVFERQFNERASSNENIQWDCRDKNGVEIPKGYYSVTYLSKGGISYTGFIKY